MATYVRQVRATLRAMITFEAGESMKVGKLRQQRGRGQALQQKRKLDGNGSSQTLLNQRLATPYPYRIVRRLLSLSLTPGWPITFFFTAFRISSTPPCELQATRRQRHVCLGRTFLISYDGGATP